MDKSAIEKVEDLALTATHNIETQLPAGCIALPNSMSLHSVERYQLSRDRFRGTFSTESIADFVSYVKDNSTGAAQGFIDGKKMTATAFFNLGSTTMPGHGDWTGTLKLEPTPAYAAMLANNGKAMGQLELLDFIEDWSHVIGAASISEDGEVKSIPITKAIAAIRKVKIEQKSATETTQNNFQAQQSRLDSVEASSDAGLPDALTFVAEPYLGLSSRSFTLRLSVITSGPKPALRFRVVGLEAEQEDIAQEFKVRLLGDIGTAAIMTIGRFTP